jgi:hypothetical protein
MNNPNHHKIRNKILCASLVLALSACGGVAKLLAVFVVDTDEKELLTPLK